MVKCTNLESGCQWIKELSYLDDHLKDCEYSIVPCTNECKQDKEVFQLFRKDLNNHLANNCPRRLFKCPNCDEKGEHYKMTGTHLATCSQVSIQCLNEGCKEKFPRWMNSIHLTVCDYQPVSCRYAEVGCEVKLISKDMKQHEEDDRFHLRIMAESIKRLKKDTIKLSNEVTSQKNEIAQHTKQVAPLIFRIEGFEARKSYSETYYSVPFYTSKRGYKLCVRVDCNGNGDGKGTHVSVFTCLMKGDNDDSLAWPFTGTVMFELLNQLEDTTHHKISVKFRPDAEHNGRVITGERRDGWGYHLIPHMNLDFLPKMNCQYLKNDTLVFRVSVQVSDYKPWLEST